jgi:thiamine-monophosphate kinase
VKRLSDIGEDALIGRLIRLVPHETSATGGPGDDCAVIDSGGNGPLQLLKTDALVEHVHYLPGAPARAVGWKSVARVISDFAAMGGKPEHFLITLALPKQTEVGWIEDVYRGIGDCLGKFGGLLAGGETSAVPEGSAAVISIAATGSVPRGHLVLRSTGSPSDILFVTGTLGGSIAGKHLDFTPRLAEAAWLVRNFKPTAMMDLSDGLGKDLPRLAAASGCGFILEKDSLPLTGGCTPDEAIGDGEDFELLFSIGREKADELLRKWPQYFPEVPLTAIGAFTHPGEGVSLEGGWDHFNSLGNQPG